MAARILIVEDNHANLELMRYLLTAFGYEAMWARNGHEALECMNREHPDLVLCDVQMPQMDGLEVVRQAKQSETLRSIPMIAVTAFAMVGDREKMLSAGFDGYVTKPIQPETFIKQMEAFLPLQLRAPPPSFEKVDSGKATPRSSRGMMILVVDNMQAHLDLASSVFEYGGYKVLTARNGDDALALAREHVPHLIMSDVCMPESSGYSLIETIKSDPRLSHIPFIFLTSTAQSEVDRKRGLALGAAKYIFRPIEPDALLAAVEDCLKN